MTRKPGDITETQFATQVEDLLTRFGWRWLHIKPAMMPMGGWASRMNEEGKGFPDYCAVRPPRLLFVELKDRLSKTTAEQDGWLGDLKECIKYVTLIPLKQGKLQLPPHSKLIPSIEVYLWRPADLESIMEVLR